MTLVVAAGCIIGLDLHPDYLGLFTISTLSLLAFSSLGALVSVSVKEVFEAQTLLNLPRFIMIFLCGVVYPVSAMPEALQVLAKFLPLTYTVSGLRSALAGGAPYLWWDSLALLAFLAAFIFPAMRLLGKKFE